jgi:hypothetical protein
MTTTTTTSETNRSTTTTRQPRPLTGATTDDRGGVVDAA